MEIILNRNERKFLSVCVRAKKASINTQWKSLYNVGLSRGRISDISKKFRKLGFIENDNYNIKDEKLEEIIELLKYNKEEDNRDIWKGAIILGAILIVTLFIGFNFLGTFHYSPASNENFSKSQYANFTEFLEEAKSKTIVGEEEINELIILEKHFPRSLTYVISHWLEREGKIDCNYFNTTGIIKILFVDDRNHFFYVKTYNC